MDADAIARNIAHWTKNDREALDGHASRSWGRPEPT